MSHTFTHKFPKVDTPYPLSRHIEHDSRSRNYTFTSTAPIVEKTVIWAHNTPVLNQGQVGSCHDPETEVLTRSGWLPFADLTMDNELATVDPVTREISYEKPTRIIEKHYSGDMHYLEGRGHNFAVTADHMMLVRKWDESVRKLSADYTQVPMAEIGWYAGLMTQVHQSGGDSTYTIPGVEGHKRASQRTDLTVDMGDWLRFLGIYLAEGTMLRGADGSNKIQIAAFKNREKTFVRDLLPRLGVQALELEDRFTFHSARIYQHMEDLGLKGVYATDKFVPRFVFNQSSEMIERLLEGHREGDGSFQNGTWTHHTSSPQLADDLQELAFLAGYKTAVSVRQPRISFIQGREVRGDHNAYAVRTLKGSQSSIERKSVRVKHYEGLVYCAEVPTHHTLVTRRHGYLLISGNCTGNAMADLLNCKIFAPCRLGEISLNEGNALKLYSLATHFDGFGPSQFYPPTDDGSSGLGVAKAACFLGYIDTYQHCFTFAQLQQAIQTQPVITGVSWTSPMFNPDPTTGIVTVGPLNDQTVQGGHEFLIQGVEYDWECIVCLNSWGANWGGGQGLKPGQFRISFADYTNLLADQGDIVVPQSAKMTLS